MLLCFNLPLQTVHQKTCAAGSKVLEGANYKQAVLSAQTWLAVTESMYADRGSGIMEDGPARGQGTLTTAAPPRESSCTGSDQ